jgi:hypothetical protein
MTARPIAKSAPPPVKSALIEAVTTLASVLEAENQALQRSDFGASGSLADAKRNAIVQLEAITTLQQAQPRQVPPALHRRLDDAIDQNRDLLRRSIETQQRVIGTILQALAPDRAGEHYPPQPGADHPHRNTVPVALALRA